MGAQWVQLRTRAMPIGVMEGKVIAEAWGVVKAVVGPVFSHFSGKRKEAAKRQQALARFYLELGDVRDRAIDAIRLLATEHNRRNDPAIRNGRRWTTYGPISSPSRIEFFTIRDIFTAQYEDFTSPQREAIAQVFEIADDYNADLASLQLLRGANFDEFDWSFALGPIASLASMAFLLAKMVELKDRFQIKDSETSTSAIETVLSAYGVNLHNAVFEEAE